MTLNRPNVKTVLMDVAFFLICLFILSADRWVELVIKLLRW